MARPHDGCRAAGGYVDKTYQYTPVDEIASVTTSADGTTEYEYDVRSHLLARRGPGFDEVFAYDERGNPMETAPGAPSRRYADGSRLVARGPVEYAYDALGRTVEKRVHLDSGATETTRYRYDTWGLLRAVELPDGRDVEFAYDAFARRVQKQVIAKRPSGKRDVVSTTRYVWDLVSIVHEIEQGASESEPTIRTYLYENNDSVVPLAHRKGEKGGADAWLHYVHDVNGAPEEIVDARGNLVATSRHTAYGRWTWSSQDAATPFRFAGQLEDVETGLHYNRYRTYDPETGRYLTQDPIGLEGGINLYAYGSNPVGWIDPMGWQHEMTVSGPAEFNARTASGYRDGNPLYQSGMQGCPPSLRSRARCHTEQKFARDLINSGTRFKGESFTLTGQLPPCPNCHRALQHAADRSGASITYRWRGANGRMQSICYEPNTAPTARGAEARTLNAAYAMTADTSRRNHYRFDDWG